MNKIDADSAVAAYNQIIDRILTNPGIGSVFKRQNIYKLVEDFNLNYEPLLDSDHYQMVSARLVEAETILDRLINN